MLVVGVRRSLLFLAEAKVRAAKISGAYLTVVLLDYEDVLGISLNMAKTDTVSCATCVSHTNFTRNHIGVLSLWSALEVRPTRVPSWTRWRRSFKKEPFLLECLASCVGGYSTGWLCVVLCSICTLHTC